MFPFFCLFITTVSIRATIELLRIFAKNEIFDKKNDIENIIL